MGTWGYSITEDDAALDAYGDYLEALNAGLSPGDIEARVRREHREALEDEDDAVSVELGIAKAKWECGHVDAVTIRTVESIIASNAGMALWEDAGAKAAQKRRKVLAAFLDKLKSPNPRPRKPKKVKQRSPIFTPGDCLAIRDPSTGQYAAAIVLLNPIEAVQPGRETWGINSIGYLDYLAPELPAMDVFERREWLYVKCTWRGAHDDWVIAVNHRNAELWKIESDPKWLAEFKKKAPDITVVGKTRLGSDEGLESSVTLTWAFDKQLATQLIPAWRTAKADPEARTHRTYRDALDVHPEVRDLLEQHERSAPMEFDTSPLEGTKA